MTAVSVVSCGGPGRTTPTINGESIGEENPAWFGAAYNKMAGEFKSPNTGGRPLECILKFTVLRSGEIEDIEIVESSGNHDFDEACRLAVTRSNPLPPIPPSVAEEQIYITVPFTNR